MDFDRIQPHQPDVAERAGQLARVIEFSPPYAIMESLKSISMRTGTRGSTWNIFRKSFSSRR